MTAAVDVTSTDNEWNQCAENETDICFYWADISVRVEPVTQ